jgi:hypothetical protein
MEVSDHNSNNKNEKRKVRYTPFSRQILRATADMFRQRADLYEQQAAMLERMATLSHYPSATWSAEIEQEPSPESLKRQWTLENAPIVLAVKSYEAMLQLQKRVDNVERLMKQNGIKPLGGYVKSRTKEVKWRPTMSRKSGNLSKDSFNCFKHLYGPMIADEMKEKCRTTPVVQGHLLKIWSTMNPRQRLSYVEIAKKSFAMTEQEDGTEQESLTEANAIPSPKARRHKETKPSEDVPPNDIGLTSKLSSIEELRATHEKSAVVYEI